MMSSDLGAELRQLLNTSQDESTTLEAVKLLLTKDKSLPLKTEISDPFTFAFLSAVSSWLKIRGMKKSAQFIKDLQENYMVFMVSKDRKSRQEAIEVLRRIYEVEPEAGMTDKLMKRRE